MTKKPGLKSVPKKEVNLEDLNTFAAGAEESVIKINHASKNDIQSKNTDEPYPWESARADVKKSINLLLPEEIMEKLRFISKHIPDSQQKYLRNIIIPVINEKINELIKK